MKEPTPLPETDVIKARRLIAFLAILLIVVVQIFLYLSPIDSQVVIPLPAWFAIYGVVLFVFSVLLTKPPRFISKPLSRISFSQGAYLISSSLVFSFLAVLGSVFFDKSPRTIYIPIRTFWVFSICCYLAAFFPSLTILQSFWKNIKQHHLELIGIGLVTVLAACLRLYRLGELPFVINGDEGWIGMVTISPGSITLNHPFGLWENFGNLYLHGIRNSIRLFGVSAFSLRLLPALGGILAIPAIYLLAREIGGKHIALLAAFFVAASHAHINFSRTSAVAYIQGTWLVPLELFFLLRGLKQRNAWQTAIGGVLLAVHFSIYLSAQIVTALIFVYMLILLIFSRSWFKTINKYFLVFWAGFLIVFLPQLSFYLQHPNEFFSRMNLDGTFQSGWLTQMMATTGKSTVQILGERVTHAFLSLIYYPAVDFYGSQTPLLTFFTATFFLIGLGVILWRVKDRNYLLLNGYFWAMTLAVGIFAIPPSADSYRMLTAFPAAIIIAAVGLVQISETMGFGWKRHRIAYAASLTIVLISILIFNVRTYFADFVGQCRYGLDTQTRYSTHLGYYLGTVQGDANVYLLSDDIIFYGQNHTVDFLKGTTAVTNFPDPIELITPAPGTIVIAIPDRIQELQVWAKNYPEGTLTYRYDCQKTILAAFEYP